MSETIRGLADLAKEFRGRLYKWAAGWLTGGPHFVVGDPARPYLRRWYVLPRNPLCNVYLHQFMRSDDDRALHDHPWPSVSLCLVGMATEHLEGGRSRTVKGGSLLFRRADHRHRMELPVGRRMWTLFVTGPAVREWGFWCPQGFRHWRDFVKPGEPGQEGKGCGE